MKKAIILSLALVLLLTGCSIEGKKEKAKVLPAEEVRLKAETFINEELIAGGADDTKATVNSIVEEDGLYKLSIVVSSQGREQSVESYVTLDGSKFFTQAIEMDAIDSVAPNAEESAPAPVVSTKKDKPTVELFVMSHCPYGTQIEKGILPVLETLGDKIDFDLKFCDYAMHGEMEIKEELNQYCIQKEQPEKLMNYLKCFLAEGNSSACLIGADVNQSKMSSCVSKTDKEFKITENLNNQATWFNKKYPQFNIFKEDNAKYSVKGSPALVINGETIAAARNSKSLLETICSSFASAPKECLTALSASNPSPGFGYGETANSATESCN